jgi:hypothetical protein
MTWISPEETSTSALIPVAPTVAPAFTVIIVPVMTQAAIIGDATNAAHRESVSVSIGPESISGAVGSATQTEKPPVPKRAPEQSDAASLAGASASTEPSRAVAEEWKPQAASRTDPPQRADAATDLTGSPDPELA